MTPHPSAAPLKVLTLRLDTETMVLPAEIVREILDLVPIAEVPNAPVLVGGLINVRGRVVPLADLRVAFDMPRPLPDQDTRIVVIEIELDGEPTVVGLLADKVYEITEIGSDAIEETPRVGMRWRPEFVRGIAKRDGGFLIIPDINRILETQGAGGAPDTAQEERLAS